MRTSAAAATAVLVLALGAPNVSVRAAGDVQISDQLRARAAQNGRVRVIVELNAGAFVPEGRLADAAVLAQRRAIRAAESRVVAKLAPADYRVARRFATVPFVALELTAVGLATLDRAGPDIVRVIPDAIAHPSLATSVPMIEGDQVWSQGYDGTGRMVAVLDTGVDATHPFLAGKVVEEACYSSTVAGLSASFCPNHLDEQIGPGAGAPCGLADCLHGTHVAGIAAGNGVPAGQSFSGVAKGAQLMAVQVFSEIIDPSSCGGSAPCAGAFASDIIAGLERVYTVAPQYALASVNLSLAGALYTAACDAEPYKPVIDTLRSIGIATVAAAGNNGSRNAIATPACISSAVSVGSVDRADSLSWFSNIASFLSLLAPGDSITSSIPGGGYAPLSGTSMATPHVAGAWAVLRQAMPAASVDTILGALRQTGLPDADTRLGGTVTTPRVRLLRALASLVPIVNPEPVATTLAPQSLRAGSAAFTLTVTGNGFDSFSVVRWNGTDRPTRVVDTHTLQASIASADIASEGPVDVTVFTPAPQGGTSNTLTFLVTPPPTLTVNAAAVAPGGSETVTLANGFGGSVDWMALAATGAPDNSYLQWTYVGNGVTSRTWTVSMPTTIGTYEFRLFLGNNTRVATSPAVTVDPSLNPLPIATSLSPARAYAGNGGLTLTVNGSSFAATSVVLWNGVGRPTTFVSATQIQASIAAADLASAGVAQVTVSTPAPGGGTTAALAFSIDAGPTLSISSTHVAGGSPVTVTLTNGIGGSGDWLALAPTGAPDATYVQWTYVGAGVTSRTWTATTPTGGGTFEFRLFLSWGYTRAATSAPIAVDPLVNPAPTVTSLSPQRATVGGAAFTLTVVGANFVNGSVVQWNGSPRATTYASTTKLQAAVGAGDLASVGSALVTVVTPSPGGGTSAALAFSIDPGPSLTVSATKVAPGSPVTVTLTNGVGGSGDWFALAATTSPNSAYLQWTYVGAGVTSRTWTVAAPSAAGAYEFRLFLSFGYTRAATSPAFTVDPSINPAPSVTSLSPARAYSGGGGFTLSVNGSGFAPASVVNWNGAPRATTFVSATTIQAAVPANDIASVGTAQVTVATPAPGGGVSSALTFTIAPSATLTLSATSVTPGAQVTVTLTNGFGGSGDWLALAPTGAPDTTYLQWTYVGGGVTTRTWTVTMPATPGTYEFRLFLSFGYTRAATSPTVTVVSGT